MADDERPSDARPTSGGGALMDFDEEEAEEDETAAESLLAASKPPTVETSKQKNALMDFEEEEEEEEEDTLLKPQVQQIKKKRKMVQEDEAEEDNEEEEEEDQEEEEQEEERSRTRERSSQQEQPDSPRGDDGDESRESDMDDEYDETGEVITSIAIPDLEEFVPKFTQKIYYAQLPRFLYIAGGAFDEDRYNLDEETDAIKKRNGERLAGDEIIRWRVKRDESGNAIVDSKGEPELESNARIVEYDDGSFQVFIGEEAVDMKITPSTNEFLYAKVTEGEDRVAFEGIAAFNGFASILPSGPNSKQQKALERALKKQQVKLISMTDTAPDYDPEQEQDKKIKDIDTKHRKAMRGRNRDANRKSKKISGERDVISRVEEDDEPRSSRKRKSSRKIDDESVGDDDEEEEEEEDEMGSMDDFIAADDDEEVEEEAE